MTYIGIDIGGTKIKMVSISQQGQIIEKKERTLSVAMATAARPLPVGKGLLWTLLS